MSDNKMPTELHWAVRLLNFACEGCGIKVLPGATQCLDCKYGPLPEEIEAGA